MLRVNSSKNLKRNAFTLAEVVTYAAGNKCKGAFTLAEVLITLGIIGVVAAMTLPELIQTNRNREVESKLKKIYSVMNQAILMSEIDNGPKELWTPSCSDDCPEYYNTYILKYIKTIRIKEFQSFNGYNIGMYFEDGSVLIGKSGYDYFFYPNAKNFNEDTFFSYDEENNIDRKDSGKTMFVFGFYPSNNSVKYHYKKGFEPYKVGLSTIDENSVITGTYGCNTNNKNPCYCNAWIQLNGWKIPKNYPFKVK